MPWFVTLGIVAVVIGLIAYAWHRLAVFAAERDWIYHEKHNPRPKGMTSLGLLEEIYQPSIQHMVQEIAEEKARGDQAQTGDKPFDEEE
jgi:hypothetical protein